MTKVRAMAFLKDGGDNVWFPIGPFGPPQPIVDWSGRGAGGMLRSPSQYGGMGGFGQQRGSFGLRQLGRIEPIAIFGSSKSTVFFDLETTGPIGVNAEITEIGAVSYNEEGEKRSTFKELLIPANAARSEDSP